MPRTLTGDVCEACGATSPAPLGRGPTCGAWETIVPEVAPPGGSGARGRATAAPIVTTRLDAVDDAALVRLPSGEPEVDRVLDTYVLDNVAVVLSLPCADAPSSREEAERIFRAALATCSP